MCGIAGYALDRALGDDRIIARLLPPLRRRGPDDEGICLIERATGAAAAYATDRTSPVLRDSLRRWGPGGEVMLHDVALVNTRYAVVDRSPGGHQPFWSGDGSIVATFNGEIYNHIELRAELEALGVRFRTTCHTEVLVEGYGRWGDLVWERMNGFWAVALYDRRSADLVLARDRLGIAPLYYRETPAGFFFASTIRSLVEIDPSSATVDRERLADFVETGMKDLDDSTLFREIRSLPPATVARLPRPAAALRAGRRSCYWRLPQQPLGTEDLSCQEAVAHFRELLFDAVAIRLRADVAVACELSGGTDSSSIVAVTALLRGERIPTYTIKVPDQDEESFARAILGRHRVDYRVLVAPEERFIVEEPDFTTALQEPYHSPNIFTHFQMRRGMKADGAGVVLSGSGGDEVLAGYEFQFWPRAAAELRARGMGWYAEAYERARAGRPPRRGLHRLAAAARRHGGQVKRAVLGRQAPPTAALGSCRSAAEYQALYPTLSFHDQRLYHFKVAMLPYYLRSNDHFTMAIPLEQRLPFLDYRVVEFGLQLPIEYLFRDGWTKYVLRQAMAPYLPEAIAWRRQKMGFPFALVPFLVHHRAEFEAALRCLAPLALLLDTSGGFDALLGADPKKLWRLCSTAFWLMRLSEG